MATINLKVDGLTCNNCVGHVTTAFEARPEVANVMVTLESGGTSDVVLTLNTDIADETIAELIDEEGYTLVGVQR
ncbi:Copper chaperone CopZ [Ruaniaceae bacterium KH17]|nr:Copper chaperone CopZ [Ruaniaceae bacterium KH17]